MLGLLTRRQRVDVFEISPMGVRAWAGFRPGLVLGGERERARRAFGLRTEFFGTTRMPERSLRNRRHRRAGHDQAPRATEGRRQDRTRWRALDGEGRVGERSAKRTGRFV